MKLFGKFSLPVVGYDEIMYKVSLLLASNQEQSIISAVLSDATIPRNHNYNLFHNESIDLLLDGAILPHSLWGCHPHLREELCQTNEHL